jgi:hypothetical protein
MKESKKPEAMPREELHAIGYKLFLVLMIREKICIGDLKRKIGNESKSLGIPAEKLIAFAETALPEALKLSLHSKWSDDSGS